MLFRRSVHVILPAAVLVVAIAAAALVDRQPSVVLTFQLVEDVAGDQPSADLRKTALDVVTSRLSGAGRARGEKDGTIVVDLFGNLEDRGLEDIRRLLTTPGQFQFRIMASQRASEHKAPIELAEEAAADDRDVRFGDRIVARWLDCHKDEFPDEQAARSHGLVVRTINDVVQALALTDDGLDVTGDYFQSVATDTDETGRPQIAFSLVQRGAFLFGQLTGAHLPTADGNRYLLGLIMDDVLLSAPSIEGKITERGRISGNLSAEEVEFIVRVLTSGSLPCELREVSVKRAEE